MAEDHGVAGSNPATPTKTFKKSFTTLKNQRFLVPRKSWIFSEIE